MKTHRTLLLFAAILLAGGTVLAQNNPNPTQVAASYEVMLQVVVGSNGSAEGSSLTPNLRGLSDQLRSNFGFANYRLDNTFVGRVGTSGTFEYKSISNTVGAGADSETPSFLEWTLGGLRSSINDKGEAVFQAEPFRFGARVPVRISTFKDDSGKAISNINYEAIGLTVNRVSLRENAPTLIGTLSLPKTAGTVFLILTVKPAP